MEMRVVVCTSGAGMVRGAEIVGTGADSIEVIYVVVLRIVSIDGAVVCCCQDDTSRSIHFSHFSFCIFDTNPSTVRVAQKRTLEGCHSLSSTTDVHVFYKSHRATSFRVQPQSAETREAVENLYKKNISW